MSNDNEPVITIVFGALLIALSLGAGWAWNSHRCSSRAEVMGMRSQWGISTGCMVRTPKGWFAIEQVRDEQ